MQGINLNKLLVDSVSDNTARYAVFYFNGTMPADLDSLGFDPFNAQALFENSVCYMTNLIASETHGPIQSTITLNRTLDTPFYAWYDHNSVTRDRAIPIPYAWANIADQAPDWSYLGTLNWAHWAGLRYNDDMKHDDVLGTYRRVGREGADIYFDMGAPLYRDITPRIQLWFEIAPADDIEWATLEPWMQTYIEAQYTGIYDTATLAFVQEDLFQDEMGVDMAIRRYTVNRLSDSQPEEIRFRHLVDSDVALGVSEPYIAATLKQTWTGEATFNFVSVNVKPVHVGTEDYMLPVAATAFSMYQRTITSRQKRPSWAGSPTYNTRCSHINFEVWDPDADDGAGGTGAYIRHLNYYGVNQNDVHRWFQTSDGPVSLASGKFRFECADGPVNNGYIITSGDPHWSLANLEIYGDTGTDLYGDGYTLFATDFRYKSTEPSRTHLTWAIVVPHPDDFTETGTDITSTKDYGGLGTNMTPLILCDVGLTGSGAAIEFDDIHTVPMVAPWPSKFQIEFNALEDTSQPAPPDPPAPDPVRFVELLTNVTGSGNLVVTSTDIDTTAADYLAIVRNVDVATGNTYLTDSDTFAEGFWNTLGTLNDIVANTNWFNGFVNDGLDLDIFLNSGTGRVHTSFIQEDQDYFEIIPNFTRSADIPVNIADPAMILWASHPTGGQQNGAMVSAAMNGSEILTAQSGIEDVTPDSFVFANGSVRHNSTAITSRAYVFAHNPAKKIYVGTFFENGPQPADDNNYQPENVLLTDGARVGNDINIGFEPKLVLMFRNSGGAWNQSSLLFDQTEGTTNQWDSKTTSSSVESYTGSSPSGIVHTANGFTHWMDDTGPFTRVHFVAIG